MKYIKEYSDGDRMSDIYLVKHKVSAVTKNGKPYDSVILQDKTGTIDAKIWDPHSAGIAEFDTLDYVEVFGEITNFQGQLQVNVKRVRLAEEGEYVPGDYLPVSSKDIEGMYKELLGIIDTIENKYIKQLLNAFFREDEQFIKAFKKSSAAKTMHHGFVGGLLEHSLSVTKLCDYYCTAYPMLKRDILLAAGMLHDMGKMRELSLFPANDYTDEGQLLGHIVIGAEMISDKVREIEGFPKTLAAELKHCILAHHGEYEYGAAKKPAIMEAMALFFADNTDAKMEMMTEMFAATQEQGWLGFNRLFDSNIRVTSWE